MTFYRSDLREVRKRFTANPFEARVKPFAGKKTFPKRFVSATKKLINNFARKRYNATRRDSVLRNLHRNLLNLLVYTHQLSSQTQTAEAIENLQIEILPTSHAHTSHSFIHC